MCDVTWRHVAQPSVAHSRSIMWRGVCVWISVWQHHRSWTLVIHMTCDAQWDVACMDVCVCVCVCVRVCVCVCVCVWCHALDAFTDPYPGHKAIDMTTRFDCRESGQASRYDFDRDRHIALLAVHAAAHVLLTWLIEPIKNMSYLSVC